MSFELFIAFKYLFSKQREKFVSLITLFSVLGVIVGVMSLNMVLAIMNGFEEDLKEKILKNTPHIMVATINKKGIPNYSLFIDKIRSIEENILEVSPLIEGQAILSSKYQVMGVSILGLDLSSQIIDIRRSLIQGRADFYPSERGVILGSELAKALGVFINDKLNIITYRNNFEEIKPVIEELVVRGIITTGMYEYDRYRAYISLRKAQELFGLEKAVSKIAIKIKDIYKADELADKIRENLNIYYILSTWTLANRNLFSALKLEKIVMSLILALIIFVAVFNITSSLIIMVTEKTREIGILKTLGASNRSIMAIFILQGLIIGISGSILGTMLGLLGSSILSHYQFIKLPSDVYYISYLPISIKIKDVLGILLGSFLLSFLATIYPSYNASRLNLVEALSYE
jgi:lipoprotein-releasing system permease protein